MSNKLEWITSVGAPALGLSGITEEDRLWIPTFLYAHPNKRGIIRELRGRKMKTVQALMDEFGAALQFFDGFGENWYALRECLCYMDEWLPADYYLLIINDTQLVLTDEKPQELHWLLTTLCEVHNWWSVPITEESRFARRAIPFHVLFQCPHESIQEVRARFKPTLDSLGIELFSIT